MRLTKVIPLCLLASLTLFFAFAGEAEARRGWTQDYWCEWEDVGGEGEFEPVHYVTRGIAHWSNDVHEGMVGDCHVHYDSQS